MTQAAPAQLEIRVANQDDARALAELLPEMDDEDAALVSTAAFDHMRKILQEMERYPNFRAYLALEQGLAVGSFSLMIYSGPAHQGAAQAILDAVVVRRARRGGGIGKAMLLRAFDIASAAGCYKMSLSSNLKRADAHRFYEQAGFLKHGFSFSIALPVAK